MESDDNCSMKQYNKKRGKYNQITLEQRKNFIKRTLCEGLTMKAAAELENINYKSAFVILKCYKKYGRIGKKQTRERKIKSQKKNYFNQKVISLQKNTSSVSASLTHQEVKQEFQSIYQVNFKNIINYQKDSLTICKIENDTFMSNYYNNKAFCQKEDEKLSLISTTETNQEKMPIENTTQNNNTTQQASNFNNSLNLTSIQKQYYEMIQNNNLMMKFQYLFSQQMQHQNQPNNKQLQYGNLFA